MMSRGTKWLIGIVVLAVLLVIAVDRVGAAVTQRAAGKALASYSEFQDTPDVTLHGVPFLTQAVGGKYDDVEIVSKSVTLGEIKGAAVDAHLDGASLPLTDLLGNRVKQIPVDRVYGSVVAPYAELARLSGVSGLTLSAQGSQLMVNAPLQAPVLGSVDVQAVGSFTITDNKLKLSVSSLKVQGVEIPQALVGAATTALAGAIDIPALPYGLRLTSTTPTATGLRLNGEADHVVLTQAR